MEALMAVVIGVLYASGLYLMMRRNIVKLIIGLSIIGHAANLLIFTAGELTRAQAPIVPLGMSTPPAVIANPLPQALILTAIVISFGVLAFTVILVHRSIESVGTDDLDQMTTTDR